MKISYKKIKRVRCRPVYLDPYYDLTLHDVYTDDEILQMDHDYIRSILSKSSACSIQENFLPVPDTQRFSIGGPVRPVSP